MLRKLFCKHKFEFVHEVNRYLFETDKTPYKITKIYMCPKCGKVIRVEIR